MANSLTHFGIPAVYGACLSIQIEYADGDGDPTDPVTPDTELSKDGGAFADCTNEVTVVTGSNGIGWLTLTSTEMQASAIGIAAKSASGPKTTLMPIEVQRYPVLASGTATAGGNDTITLEVGSSAVDDYYTGCLIKTTGGTGGAAGAMQARWVLSYDGATRVCTVGPNVWETNPSSDTTYELYLTERRYNWLTVLAGELFYQTLTDTATLTDSANKLPARTLTDTAALTEALLRAIARTLTETATGTEALTRAMTRALTETATVTDILALTRLILLLLTDTATGTDSITKATGRALTETATAAEVLTRAVARALAEALTGSDTATKETARLVTDTTTGTDSADRMQGRTVSEVVTATDTYLRTVGKLLAEVATADGSIRRDVTRTLSETATLLDTLIQGLTEDFTLVLEEVATVTDSVHRAKLLILAATLARLIIDAAHVRDALDLRNAADAEDAERGAAP